MITCLLKEKRPWCNSYIILVKGSNLSRLVPAENGPFSTRALIWVHFKTVQYFYQPIFSLFSYLKNAPHNFVIELCSAPFFSKNIAQLFIKFTHGFVAIELSTFYKNAKKLFYCSREIMVFRTKTWLIFLLFVYINVSQKNWI